MTTTPREKLDCILGYLGFAFEIEEGEHDGRQVLQILTHDDRLLIGRDGETLDDLQFLVNRLVQLESPDAPKVVVDCEHYREMRDDRLVTSIEKLAEVVRNTGRPIHTDPLNSYDRYVVHNHFKDSPDIATWSPDDSVRFKRITLRKR